jgi:carboxyl-terminal processing protease
MDLAGGTSLKVTIAKWFTPKGYSIHNNGLKPDVSIELKAEDVQNNKDPQLDKAVSTVNNSK